MLGTGDEAAQAKVGASMAHVEELLKGVKEGTGLLNAMVYDEEMPRRVKSIMRNLDTASAGTLKELLSAVAVYAAGGRLALENLAEAKGGEVLRIAHQMKGGEH